MSELIHVLRVPMEIVRVEGPARFGPKKSKRAWCHHKPLGHLYDADRFYAALKAMTLEAAELGYCYESHWVYACEECATRLGWVATTGEKV